MVAPEIALSAAKVRSSSASGSMNDTRISDPMASTRKITRSLMAAPAGRSGGSDELDPDAPDRVQVPGLMRVLSELAPQPGDMDIHGLVGAGVRHSPDVREQVFLRDDLTRAHGQVEEQVEFTTRQVDRLAVEQRLMGFAIEAKPADHDRLAATGLIGRPPQHRPDPRLDLA